MEQQINTENSFLSARLEEVNKIRQIKTGGFYCPICGEHSEKFIDGGVVNKRKNAKCPVCGSLERHRLIWMCFVNIIWPTLSFKKINLLHVAPEKLISSLLYRNSKVNYISGDLMMTNTMIKLDLTEMHFWNDQFDIIICSHILEHIPDDTKAMKEMYRILKPKGHVLVMVPIYGMTTYEDFSITDPTQRIQHFGQSDHVRKYGYDIADRLTSAGFDVSTWPADDSGIPEIMSFTSCNKRFVHLCTKH